MFDKKSMKLIKDYKKAQEYLLAGIPVYMVKLDGSLEELTEANDLSLDNENDTLIFHNLKGGRYAVYRKKLIEIGEFQKDIHIGNRILTVSHTMKGGGSSWMFASCRDEE